MFLVNGFLFCTIHVCIISWLVFFVHISWDVSWDISQGISRDIWLYLYLKIYLCLLRYLMRCWVGISWDISRGKIRFASHETSHEIRVALRLYIFLPSLLLAGWLLGVNFIMWTFVWLICISWEISWVISLDLMYCRFWISDGDGVAVFPPRVVC